MHRDAFDALIRELNKDGIPSFTTYTHNRLKNEDPLYALLIEHLAGKCSQKSGSDGFAMALQIGAICHRARELAEQYKDTTTQYQTIVDDPIPSIEAVVETEDLLSILTISTRNIPKK